MTSHLLIDAHVHFHSCFHYSTFLDGALANFGAAVRSFALDGPTSGCLLLAETAGQDWFRRLRDDASPLEHSGWSLRPTDEACTVIAERPGEPPLVIAAGRQIVTREGVEVLALAIDGRWSDGLPLSDTVHAVLDSDALAVLPWGFGKWWFQRGHVVERAIADIATWSNGLSRGFFVADSGLRPRIIPASRRIQSAAWRRFRNLPGSDPLPFADHARRAGSFGSLVPAELDLRRPAVGLKNVLRSVRTQPRLYGRPRGFWSFLRDQGAMQVKSRFAQRRQV